MSISSQLIPELFAMHQAQYFAESFAEPDEQTYYMFAARHYTFPGGDANVSAPVDTVSSLEFDLYQDMIFGKQLNQSNIKMAIKRYDWVSNTVYDKYNNKDPLLSSKQFYVGVQNGSNYDVFKCLNNNNGSPSTSVPTKSDTSESDNFYQTSDGYQWKYMYSINASDFSNFATADYIPITPNANVAGNATPGAIDVVEVIYPGNGYINFVSGSFQSTSEIQVNGNTVVYQISANASTVDTVYQGCYLYITNGVAKGQFAEIVTSNSNVNGKFVQLTEKLGVLPSPGDTYEISPKVVITGEGNQTVNAQARALITGSSVTGVQIIGNTPGGEGYGFATAYVYASPYVGLNPAYAANLNPIISPKEGHGGNPDEELFSTSVSIGVKFANTEGNTVFATSSYRTIGLIRSPLFSNVALQVNSISGFIPGHQVIQANTNASGYVTSVNTTAIFLTNVYGNFVAGNTTYGVITDQTSNSSCYVNGNIYISGIQKDFSTYDQTYKYTGVGSYLTFSADEPVYVGNTTQANALYLTSNSTTLVVTNKIGTFAGSNTIVGTLSSANFIINNTNYEKKPDIIFGTGDILYVENFEPITRANNKTETLKLILSF